MSAYRACWLLTGVLLLAGCETMYYGTNPTTTGKAGKLQSDGSPILDERTGQPPPEWPQTVPAPATPPR